MNHIEVMSARPRSTPMSTGFERSTLEEVQNRRYLTGQVYLPHDARNKHIDAKKSVYQQTRDAYPGDGRVIVVPRTQSVMNDINAVRNMFPRLWFNEKLCADGLHGLAHYRYEVDPQDSRDISDVPLHDWASHPADALRTYIMGLRDHVIERRQKHVPYVPPRVAHGQGWMAQ